MPPAPSRVMKPPMTAARNVRIWKSWSRSSGRLRSREWCQYPVRRTSDSASNPPISRRLSRCSPNTSST